MVETIGGQLFDLNRAELRQDPGIENILCALHRDRRFLSGNFAEIVLDRVRDRIGAVAKPALGNLSLAVGPAPGVLLWLPIVENADAIGLKGVIRNTDRFGRVNARYWRAVHEPAIAPR